MTKGDSSKYNALKERYQELYDHLLDVECERQDFLNELRYLEAFVEYKKLSDEFAYFKKHARETYDDNMPFSTLTL